MQARFQWLLYASYGRNAHHTTYHHYYNKKVRILFFANPLCPKQKEQMNSKGIGKLQAHTNEIKQLQKVHLAIYSPFFSRPIDDIDLPEDLPDFLKPKPSTPRPLIPIQDIDLPDGASVIQPDESEIEEEPKEEEGKG